MRPESHRGKNTWLLLQESYDSGDRALFLFLFNNQLMGFRLVTLACHMSVSGWQDCTKSRIFRAVDAQQFN